MFYTAIRHYLTNEGQQFASSPCFLQALIYFLTYLTTYLLTYLLAYLITYLLIYFLT
jgi:hypothetical protein